MTMTDAFTTHTVLADFPLWGQLEGKRVPLSFDLEVTARCNNACKHCYINLPAGDRQAQQRELSLAEIGVIADEAVAMGSLWCLITGGEPLLRQDFPELYLLLKRKGLLVSVFTNACLITDEHIQLFQKYPPRDMEVSVYGVTQETYESVTRRPGSYAAFRRGLDLLKKAGIKVRLKAMALRSNVHELPAISRFCREYTSEFYRFDPLLHLRYDGDPVRNDEIRAERLSPEEISFVEQSDPRRSEALQKDCSQLLVPENEHSDCAHLFHCGAGVSSFSVGYDGTFRLCSSLTHPACTADLRSGSPQIISGSLSDAWSHLVPQVRLLEANTRDFKDHCRTCSLINLCLWCPASAYLECGRMEGRSEYFCRVAQARADAIATQSNGSQPISSHMLP